MPVTARLSKAFYDRFGESATNELVDWFNAVDSTYRADLRELNELNFARFDAKLGQRLAELEMRWEKRFVELEARIEQLRTEFRAELRAAIAASESRIVCWMFMFWTGNLVATAGIVFTVMRLGR